MSYPSILQALHRKHIKSMVQNMKMRSLLYDIIVFLIQPNKYLIKLSLMVSVKMIPKIVHRNWRTPLTDWWDGIWTSWVTVITEASSASWYIPTGADHSAHLPHHGYCPQPMALSLWFRFRIPHVQAEPRGVAHINTCLQRLQLWLPRRTCSVLFSTFLLTTPLLSP